MQIRRKSMISIKFTEKELKFIITLLSTFEQLPPKLLSSERRSWLIMLRMKFQDARDEALLEEVHYESETDSTEY